MSEGYKRFKESVIETWGSEGYEESVIINSYMKAIEKALESAEMRADQNYSDLLAAQEEIARLKGELDD